MKKKECEELLKQYLNNFVKSSNIRTARVRRKENYTWYVEIIWDNGRKRIFDQPL